MMFVALAVVPFLFNSCTSTSKEDVVYQMAIVVDGQNSFIGSPKGEAKALYDEIAKNISYPEELWTEEVIDGDSSAADSKAIAKYNDVETSIKAKVAEYQAKIDALQDPAATFVISEKLVLYKVVSEEPRKELKSYKIYFNYSK